MPHPAKLCLKTRREQQRAGTKQYHEPNSYQLGVTSPQEKTQIKFLLLVLLLHTFQGDSLPKLKF